jgi:hypothetical protein
MKNRFQREGLSVSNGGLLPAGQHHASETRTQAGQHGIRQLIALFCSLELLDAVVTFWAINQGLVWEGNALVARMAGSWSFIFVKLTGAVLSGLVIQIMHKHFPKLATAAAVSIVVFYGFVLAWNASMIINLIASH